MSRVPISLPERALRLLDEARWFASTGAGVLLVLILLTYDRNDPGWSNAGPAEDVSNAGGRLGAWLADLLLYLFGASAWIWVGLLAVQLWRGAARMRVRELAARGVTVGGTDDSEGFAWDRWLGFFLFFFGCVGLESQRMQSMRLALPLAPGGVVGDLVANVLTLSIGVTGTTMTLLGAIAIGFSLLARRSWFEIFESAGALVERAFLGLLRARDAQQDRAIGQQAALERDESVDEKKLKVRSASDATVETVSSTASGVAAASVPNSSSRASATNLSEPTLGGLFAQDDAPLSFEQSSAPTALEGDLETPQLKVDVLAQKPEAFVQEAEPVDPSAGFEKQEGQMVEPLLSASHSLRIEPPAPPAEKSVRVLREAQSSLFGKLAGADQRPSVVLLEPPPVVVETVSPESIAYTSRLIEKKLSDFGVAAAVVTAQPGPVITRYEIEPATGVKGSQIVNLGKDLARALSLTSLRVVETIPGKNVMGLELPNAKRQTVRLSEILSAKVFADAPSALTMALGKDISGHAVVADLARMPHLLVAGTTGSGKSVGINAMLLSLLYKSDPAQVRLILIDPKMLEMSVYEGIPHLLAPVVTDMRQAANALNWCVGEMERRYRIMSKLGVRNLAGFNSKIAEAEQRETLIPNPFSLTPDAPEPLGRLPQIGVVIDELADLMMVVGKKIEELIARLAQKARAAGIHLILATQRPSVDVITGLIKANIPTRIAFQVSSKIDSRTILDQMGAESLLGMGDMLYLPPGSGVPMRVHGAFVADEEVHRVVEHWKAQGDPDYVDGLLEGGVVESADTGSAVGFGGLSQTLAEAGVEAESDPMYDQAVAIVLQNRRASISLVQRHLRIGYNRAARLLEQMEKSGVVSAMASNGNRDVLVPAREA